MKTEIRLDFDDINGDGIKDVVIGTGGNNELVYTISGKNRTAALDLRRFSYNF